MMEDEMSVTIIDYNQPEWLAEFNRRGERIAELEKMAEARKLANRLLEQERNELEAERDRLREALERVVKLLDRPMLKDDMCLYMDKAIKVAREALEGAGVGRIRSLALDVVQPGSCFPVSGAGTARHLDDGRASTHHGAGAVGRK